MYPQLYGAIVGYEGLITKKPVKVYENDEGMFTFDNHNEEYFLAEKFGFSTDGSYYYFVSADITPVDTFILGVKTAHDIIREVAT